MPEKGEVRSGWTGIRALRPVLVVAAAVTLFVAGCGTDEPEIDQGLAEETTTAPTTTTTTTTTAPTTTTTTSLPKPPPPPAPEETKVAPKPPPPKPPAPKPAPKPEPSCDPSYPDVCIAPGPDLDCPDIPHKNIRVLPPDPHGLDGNDNDGIGCES